MSRLDIFIDRMVSQRACLDHAIAATAGPAEGPAEGAESTGLQP